jgi:anti-anti-sigma regulatory factor
MVVRMAMISVWLNIDEKGVAPALQGVEEKLDGAEGEVIVDFAAVRRIDLSALRAIEGLAGIADKKAIKVVLRGVNIDIYKVLKLVKLAPRFSFVSSDRDRETTESGGCHAESATK